MLIPSPHGQEAGTGTEPAVTLEMVVSAVNEVLGDRHDEWTPVGGATAIEELGLDSLDLTELFVALEEKAGIELDPASVDDPRTVGDLTELRPL